MDSENNTHVGMGLKIAMGAVVVFMVLVLAGAVFLPMLQTVGGSFGYGYPSGSGGRAIRDVVIDVEPQVVYRIDEHRFFTFENYLDCNSGGFVYYNDTNKKIKVFAGIEGQDKKPQDEVSVMQKNNVLSFYGKFIYAAGDDVIAYPDRNVDYKYGGSTYFVIYERVSFPAEIMIMELSLPGIPLIIKDDAVITKVGGMSEYYREHKIPLDSKGYDLLTDDELNFPKVSIDDHFHCDNTIRPRKVKYI